MKISFILFLLFLSVDVFPQCYPPDTTKIPLSRYTNSYAYFTGNDSGCFLRTRYLDELALEYENIDSFKIEWKMKLKHSDSSKHRYIFGMYDSTYNEGWFVSFNMVNVYDPLDSNLGFLEFYTDSLGFKKLYRIGFLDSNWHSYKIIYSKTNTNLICIVDDTLRFSDGSYNHGWNKVDPSVYTFSVGYRGLRNEYGVTTFIPVSPYYFKGYIDGLKITYIEFDAESPLIFNWSFDEGAGQYVRDSSDYKVYEITYPDLPTNLYNAGKHLQNGLLGVPEKYDIIWFNDTSSAVNCPFTALTDGVRTWNSNPGYMWDESLILGVCVWDGNLVTLGLFNRINSSNLSTDDGDIANFIAIWNPNNNPQWSTLGNGFDFPGRDVISYDDTLYATGLFIASGKVTVNRIAKWNGASWVALGSGLDIDPLIDRDCWGNELEVWNDNLYVGGNFNYAGGLTCNRIAKWDGTNWDTLSQGLNYDVWALEPYDSCLYVGGSFSGIVGSPLLCYGIAKWDGSNWDTLGSFNRGSHVYTLCVYKNELYAGGDFTSVNGIACNGIAKYNTNTGLWYNVGNGVDGLGKVVKDMKIYNDELYIAGSFYYMNGIPVNKICKFDSSIFCAISNGIEQQVHNMTVYNNELIVAGDFYSADGERFNNVLRYYSSGSDFADNTKMTAKSTILNQNYPNPFNPKTTIKFTVLNRNLVTLKIYDILGREIKTLINQIKEAGTYFVEFDASNYASGIYFYKVESGNFVETKKMVLLK